MATLPSMMALILAWLCSSFHASSPPFRINDMNLLCNKTINLFHAELLQVSTVDTTKIHTRCTVQIEVQPHYSMLMSLQQASDSLSGIFCRNTSQNQIYIYDAHARLQSVRAGPCDPITTDRDVVSTSSKMTVHFHSSITETYQSFLLLLIPFHAGDCRNEEHRCRNRRCINQRLRCKDNYNTCINGDCLMYKISGDNTYPSTVPIVFIVLSLVTIVTVCVACWFWRTKRRRQRRRLLRDHTERRTLEACSALTEQSVVTAPAYTPPSDPPPYSTLPIKDNKKMDNDTHISEKYSKKKEIFTGQKDDPPPYVE